MINTTEDVPVEKPYYRRICDDDSLKRDPFDCRLTTFLSFKALCESLLGSAKGHRYIPQFSDRQV